MEKLTLQEIRKLAESQWEGCDGCDENDKQMWINGFITGTLANQVELPSDKEMDKFLLDNSYEYGYGYRDAIDWVKKQILNQNK